MNHTRSPSATVNSRGRMQVLAMHSERRHAAAPGSDPAMARNAVVDRRHPRARCARSRSAGQFHAQSHLPANAFDDAHHIGVALADGHEIDEAHRAARRSRRWFRESACGRDSGACISSPRPPGRSASSRSFRAQQRGEAGVGREIGPAQPVDGAFAVDQGGRLAIADQGIVFDLRGHRCTYCS